VNCFTGIAKSVAIVIVGLRAYWTLSSEMGEDGWRMCRFDSNIQIEDGRFAEWCNISLFEERARENGTIDSCSPVPPQVVVCHTHDPPVIVGPRSDLVYDQPRGHTRTVDSATATDTRSWAANDNYRAAADECATSGLSVPLMILRGRLVFLAMPASQDSGPAQG
jgi:hypothetical protein